MSNNPDVDDEVITKVTEDYLWIMHRLFCEAFKDGADLDDLVNFAVICKESISQRVK